LDGTRKGKTTLELCFLFYTLLQDNGKDQRGKWKAQPRSKEGMIMNRNKQALKEKKCYAFRNNPDGRSSRVTEC